MRVQESRQTLYLCSEFGTFLDPHVRLLPIVTMPEVQDGVANGNFLSGDAVGKHDVKGEDNVVVVCRFSPGTRLITGLTGVT